VVTRNPFPGRVGGSSLGGPIPKDLLVILGILLATLSLRYFESTAFLPALLDLTPAVWRRGWIWQLVTYPFIGNGEAGFFFLLQLFFVYMFGRDVYFGLYRRHFWRLIFWSAIGAALVAVLVHVLLTLAGFNVPTAFVILQGGWVLLVIFIAAFATAHRDATVYLFFFLPVPAWWMFPIEILGAFMAFLRTRDFPGFLGVCAAVGLSYLYVKSSGAVLGKRGFREMRLRLERWWIQKKLDRARRKRGFRVIPGEGKRDPNVRKGPWVN
jgi:hypothetical protein